MATMTSVANDLYCIFWGESILFGQIEPKKGFPNPLFSRGIQEISVRHFPQFVFTRCIHIISNPLNICKGASQQAGTALFS